MPGGSLINCRVKKRWACLALKYSLLPQILFVCCPIQYSLAKSSSEYHNFHETTEVPVRNEVERTLDRKSDLRYVQLYNILYNLRSENVSVERNSSEKMRSNCVNLSETNLLLFFLYLSVSQRP